MPHGTLFDINFLAFFIALVYTFISPLRIFPTTHSFSRDKQVFRGRNNTQIYYLPSVWNAHTAAPLAGQKRDPPEERDPLRIFYESLYSQRSDSDMAAFWLMESGLLPKDEAKKVFERKQKKAQMQKLGSPMKSTTTTVKKTTQSVTVKKKIQPSPESSTQKKKIVGTKKRKVEDDSDGVSDDDFVISKKVNKKQKAA